MSGHWWQDSSNAVVVNARWDPWAKAMMLAAELDARDAAGESPVAAPPATDQEREGK